MKKTCTLLFSVVLLAILLIALPVSAEDNITVILNGETLHFDVQPVLMNDRTMVPMRTIFEALDTTVYWSDFNETVTAYSPITGTVTLPIGADIANVNGEMYELDQPAVLKNDRTLVPLRFVSEALGCTVDWEDATQTVTITRDLTNNDKVSLTRYYSVSDCYTLGGWTVEGDGVIKGKTTTNDGERLELGVTDDDAELLIDIPTDGTYKIWGLSKDYATNQPGSRFFHIAVDGVRSETVFGAHGKEGFAWNEVGTYTLTKGKHKISFQDTSCFYARAMGVMVTPDLSFTPPATGYMDYYQESEDKSTVIPANYPLWAKGAMTDTAVETIENDKIKIEFYQGTTERGTAIQNRILLNQNGQWVEVKGRHEELGVLAMRANEAPVSTTRPPVASLASTPWHRFESSFDTLSGTTTTTGEKDFYKTGAAEWLIPTTMTKVDDKTVVLGMSSANVDATLTYTYDALTFEPKVTFNATIKKDGGYSFVHFTGDDFKDGTYSRVTAPLMYTKDFVPDDAYVLAEYMMFTPMVSFTFGEGEEAITKGIVVDPTYVRQDVATPGRSDFGVMFRSPTGNVRGQIIAPLYGSENAIFTAGQTYSFAYRLIYNNQDWYDNYKHVAQDIYNCVDLRTNYYASLNEAIYNTTDLIMDDIYGGWDDKDMGFYNMEAEMVTTISNGVELMQRYMLTDNEEILDERAVPALAFMLSRGGMHFKRVEGDNSYTPQTPVALSGVNNSFGPSTYIALYRMSQGRMPFLFNYAVSQLGNGSNISNVTGYTAMDDMLGAGTYRDEIIKSADNYLLSLSKDSEYYTTPYGGFVYTRDVPMLQAFITAYEATGEQKYLDGAEEVGQLIMAALWTTGYQNDYATTDYTVTPEKVYSRPMANDTARWFYHKDGVQWRVGNEFGINSSVYDEGNRTQNLVKTETGPGWLPARTGMSTEHTMTPSNGNAITMNMWAGTGLRLGAYTGDDFFITQARNAMIGRFANYSGYYYERYLLHDKQANYPYDGPDTNMIYWHHIPVFLGLLEDFLINDIWEKSDGNVEFPTAVNQGYAYFVTNQYGFDSGRFYDEDDMWIWLDRGIAEPDSVEVDYLPAKKAGTLGIAFVNEGDKALTTTVTLGEKIPNAASFTETATLYDKDGNKSTVEIVNGKFTLTIPAKGIQSVVLHPDVDIPSYAKEYTPSIDMGQTVVSYKSGKAYLMQFNDEHYYAYMYTNLKPEDIRSATFAYTIDGKAYTETVDAYPFEKIVKVNAANDFAFTVTVTNTDGTVSKLGSGTLKPVDTTSVAAFKKGDKAAEEEIVSSLDPFENFTLKIDSAGCGTNLRLVVTTSNLPFELKENVMAGLKIKGVFVDNKTGVEVLFESVITGNEVRDGGKAVLLVNPTEIVPYDDYCEILNYTKSYITIISPDKGYSSVKIENEEAMKKNRLTVSGKIETTPNTNTNAGVAMPEDFEPFAVKYTGQGVGGNDTLRFVVSLSEFPFEVSVNSLKDLQLTVIAKETATGKTETYTVTISGNEMRDSATVIVFNAPNGLPAVDYDNGQAKTHKFNLIISKPNADVSGVDISSKEAVTPESFEGFTVKPVSMGAATYLRAVCDLSQFPFAVSENSLKGLKVKVQFTLNGKKYTEEAALAGNEMRTASNTTVLNIDCETVQKMFNSDKEWAAFKPEIVFVGR